MRNIQLGVSSCLLGNEVRYDGGHRRDEFLLKTLGPYFDFHAFCPEVAIGMGVPRPPIQLRQFADGIHVVDVANGNKDFTQSLRENARDDMRDIGQLAGFVFKRGSPSCGVFEVDLFTENGTWQSGTGTGVYVAEIVRAYPHLPVEQEDGLAHDQRRMNFLERVSVMDRWHKLFEKGMTSDSLDEFHRGHRLNVLCRSEAAYQELELCVSNQEKLTLEVLSEKYLTTMMQILKRPVSEEDHFNVLEMIYHDIEGCLDRQEKNQLRQALKDYRVATVTLQCPIDVINQILVTRPDNRYSQQYYLHPHPVEAIGRG